MKNALLRGSRRMGQTVCCAMLLFALQGAQAAPHDGRAVVSAVSGSAEYQLAGETQWQPVRVGMALSETTSVRTATQSSVDLVLTTGSIVRLAPNSLLHFNKLLQESPGLPGSGAPMIRHSEMTLDSGQASVMASKQGGGSTFRINTPYGPVDVKGTSLLISLVGGHFVVRCVEGGPVTFQVGGQFFTVGQGQQMTGTVGPNGQLTVTGLPSTAPTNDGLAVAFNQFQQNQVNSGIASLVLNQSGPINLDQLMQLVASQSGGQPVVVIVGPSTLVKVSPSTP